MLPHRFVVQIYFVEEQITNSPRTRRTKQQIKDLLIEFDQSDCTVKTFCLLHGMSPGTFYKRQSRYGNRAEQKDLSAGFMQVSIRSSLPDTLFAEVNGIRLYRPVSASFLKELLP